MQGFHRWFLLSMQARHLPQDSQTWVARWWGSADMASRILGHRSAIEALANE
jgi:hypothetical protein